MTILYVALAVLALPLMLLLITIWAYPELLYDLGKLLRPIVGSAWTLVVIGLLLIAALLVFADLYAPGWIHL